MNMKFDSKKKGGMKKTQKKARIGRAKKPFTVKNIYVRPCLDNLWNEGDEKKWVQESYEKARALKERQKKYEERAERKRQDEEKESELGTEKKRECTL